MAPPRTWTDAGLRQLLRLAEESGSVARAAERMGRNQHSAYHALRRHGFRTPKSKRTAGDRRPTPERARAWKLSMGCHNLRASGLPWAEIHEWAVIEHQYTGSVLALASRYRKWLGRIQE